jgi:hypothetical protein
LEDSLHAAARIKSYISLPTALHKTPATERPPLPSNSHQPTSITPHLPPNVTNSTTHHPLASNAQHQTRDTKHSTSSTRHQALDFKHSPSSTRHQTLAIKHPPSNTRRLSLRTDHRNFGANNFKPSSTTSTGLKRLKTRSLDPRNVCSNPTTAASSQSSGHARGNTTRDIRCPQEL